MLLEFAQFASLLITILSLNALFHSAFLEPGSSLEQRLLPACERLLLAAATSLVSACIFRLQDRKTDREPAPQPSGRGSSVAGSLPMMIFWWGAGTMAVLFATAWLIERYRGLWR